MGPIILFDGACNLCEGSVRFVIAHDPAVRYRFASLQSITGTALRAQYGVTIDSVTLIEDGRAYVESDAALRIAASLGGPWSWVTLGRVLPRFLRNAIYRFIARHRYQWFGRKEVCWLPTPDLAARFLE